MLTKPNILFLFADDQRFDTIRALGNGAIHTPNLDRLVARGTTFTNAHIPGGTSGAVCMPSRAMVLTGRSLFQIDGAGEQIPVEHQTIGEVLQSHGYHCYGVGKWHNGRSSFNRAFNDGDNIFFGGMDDHWNVPVYGYDPTGRYDAVLPYVKEPLSSNTVQYRHGHRVHVGTHSSEVMSDAAISFLNDYDRDDPFFAYVAYLAPHDPRTMPAEYLAMYDPDDIELPPNFSGQHPFDNGELHVRDEKLAGFPRCPDEVRRHIAEYYGMITHLDAQIGRVLDALDASGRAEDTIVVFAADNGLAVGQHGLFGKQSCYDHSLRVPLVFAGPGVPEGVRSEANVYLFDVFATLADLVGIAQPDGADGKSMVDAMHNPSRRLRDCMYFAYRGFQRAVKRDGYKLIEYVVKGEHAMTQLFHVEEDPWETRNLAEELNMKALLSELRRDLVALSDEWGDRDTQWGEQFWSVMDNVPLKSG